MKKKYINFLLEGADSLKISVFYLSENKPTKKGMDSFFVVSDQLYVEDEKEHETVNFESLKDKEKDIQVDISVQAPKSKNLKTPSLPNRAEDFTAQMVAFKALFMN